MRLLQLQEREADTDLVMRELRLTGMDPVTARVASKDDFIAAISSFAPDVVLASHSLPGLSAVAALTILRALRPSAPLIVVSDAVDERVIIDCVRAGVEDIVPKNDLGRLAGSIQEALAVRRPMDRLTPRQLEVFRLIAEGMSTPAIARRLRLSVKTIGTHRAEAMKRLGVHDVVALVRYAIRVGLVPRDAPVGEVDQNGLR